MIRFVLLLLACVAMISQVASAQTSVTDGVLINADSMYRDLDKRLVRLQGNVQVVFQGQHLSCQKAELDLRRQTITASDKVILSNERVHVEGDRIVFNYRQNTGRIFNGFVQSGQVVFAGDLIEKVAEDRYIAHNAEYSACETCPPGWAFSGRKIDAQIGGYARIQRPVFKVAGVPVLILPGLIVPLKSARQSGVLVPTLNFSRRGGMAIGQSYFWAIDRSQDLTATAIWYEKRGVKAHGDYRYVLSETSQGRLQSAWIRDRELTKELAFDNAFDRWYAWYTHRMDLPGDQVHRVDIKAVSDLRYSRDFPDELQGHGDPALENRMSISKTSDNHYYSGEVDVYTNLLRSYALPRNDDAVHRFPHLRYSLKEEQIGGEYGPYFGVDMEYVNFARQGQGYDDLFIGAVPNSDIVARQPIGMGPQGEILRDGRFDPATDLMRSGQRMEVRPTLTYPFQIARRFDVLPAVSYRETQYRFHPTVGAEAAGFSETAARRFMQADLRVKTEFSRVFGSNESTGNRWKHAIEPEVGYSHIPWMRTPRHPFFGNFEGQQYTRQFEPISDTEVANPNSGLQFDYQDRTYQRQVLDFGITNRLTRKSWLNGVADYRTAALFRLWQSYDFNEARNPTPRAWSSINSLLDVRLDRFETYTTAAYNPYAKVTNVSTRMRVKANERNFAQVSYTRAFILDEDFRVTPNGETRNIGFGLGLVTKYLEALGQVDYNALELKLQSWHYRLNIIPPGRCWMIRLEHRQVVGSDDPQITGSIAFEFGGETQGNQRRF